MANTFRTAFIFVRNTYAGELKETDYGYSFSYAKSYLASARPSPVSLSLPIQENEYRAKTLFPFFDGLIPEGWLLAAVSRNWKISLADRFGLLLVACKDSIGNVAVRGDVK